MKNIFAIAFVLYGTVCGINTLMASAAGTIGSHKGQIIQVEGKEYEVVRNVRERKIQIYTSSIGGAELPSSLIVKVKENNTILDRFRLTLIQNREPNSPAYSATVPANILISGGITFEIDF